MIAPGRGPRQLKCHAHSCNGGSKRERHEEASTEPAWRPLSVALGARRLSPPWRPCPAPTLPGLVPLQLSRGVAGGPEVWPVGDKVAFFLVRAWVIPFFALSRIPRIFRE